MRQICKYHSNFDSERTRPGLSTSIRLALESGVVMDTGIDSIHNDIDDPSGIWGRISDVFEAIDVQKRVLSSGKKVNPSVEPSQPARGETE